MKRVGLCLCVTLLSCLLSIFDAAAQVTSLTGLPSITSLPKNGLWSGGKLTTDVTVSIDGLVTMAAPIVIPNGRTLTIKKDVGKPAGLEYATIRMDATFAVPTGAVHCMFEVQEGGKLIIQGNDIDTDFIAIKGNSGYETPQLASNTPTQAQLDAYLAEIEAIYNTAEKNCKITVGSQFLYDFRGTSTGKDAEGNNEYRNAGGVIYPVGTFEMRHAKITCAFSKLEGAAIRRPLITYLSTNSVFGPMTLDHVEIRGCMASSGPAMIIYNQKQNSWGAGNTPTSCKTTMTDCWIYRNYCRATGACGTLRTGGGVVGDLEMTRVNIYQNYSRGYGTGLVAAGQGLEETRTVLNGCSIRYNRSLASYGAGALLAGSFEFSGAKTKIYGNTAATYGGGIHIITYNGVKYDASRVLSMKFNDKLEVYDNTAELGGGGMCFFMRNTTSLDPGATINLDIDGAVVRNNTSTNGGGIFLSYNNTTLNINLNINSGSIKDNTASESGGGIYCQIGTINTEAVEVVDVSKCKVKLNGGVISGNTATNGSGGGVAVFDLPIYCDENASGITVNGNKSYNSGGGIYVENAQFTMNSGHVYGNECIKESGEGGGIFCTDGSVMNITGGTIGGNDDSYANKAFNGAGVFTNDSDLTMNQGTVKYNKTLTPLGAGSNAGGIYVKGTSNFTFNNGTISNNTSTVHGGGIYVLGCDSFSITDGVISDNIATNNNGGAIFLTKDAKNVTISGGEIRGNKASNGSGGAMAMAVGANITGGAISGNSAKSAGGIYLSAATHDLVISGGEVSENTSSGVGGGIYVVNGNLFVNDGKIQGNVAGGNGGGVNFNSADGQFLISGGKILENQSSGHGGGIYVAKGNLTIEGGEVSSNKTVAADKHGGGIYFASQNLTINNGDITKNEAYTNGGGICVVDNSANYVTTVTMTGGDVNGNSAKVNGGGVYVENAVTFNFSGGNINDNSALIGGAICNRGGALSFTGGSITNNVARCGGGIFLSDSGTQMTFGNGLIRNNKAVDGSGHTLTTGYGYDVSGGALALQGTGGGIYIQNGASMSFTSEDVGIYANSADTMADDIYSNGSNGASITLPDVSSMNLSGYNSRTSELYWVEDYMTGDTGYSNGTAIAGASHKAVRYRDAIAAQSTVYPLQADKLSSYSGKYLALSIGYEVIYVTLQRTGLQAGESAIYRIFRIDNGVPSVYSEVLLTGAAGVPLQSKRVALYSGKWRVEETLWTWTYVPPAAIERDITGSTDAQNKVFSFTAAKKDSMPLHAEDIVVNDFGEGVAVTGSYINSSSINDLQETTDYQLQ